MHLRSLFLHHVAQTSEAPIALEITKAEGSYLYDAAGKKYLDLIGGISVCHVGHRHPEVVAAIKKQADEYLHIMVYGELIQSPQVLYAKELCDTLPENLSSVYFTNSGAEAVEGAIKLAKRVTGKTNIIAAHKSYHGSTTGALSLLGDEYWRNAFRPLMPCVYHENYNSEAFLQRIDEHTAAVVLETVQAEAGVQAPHKKWMQQIRQRCTEVGALLILDEIQCGFGRTGTLWAFEQLGIVPDVLLLGKALGGGMPLGCFIASTQHMNLLSHDPVLGHITTFGGHPVCCAAGRAAFKVLREAIDLNAIEKKGQLFESLLQHPKIKSVSRAGFWMAVELENFDAVLKCLQIALDKGVFSDWFLFASNCIRIVPPFTLTDEEIHFACTVIKESLDHI